MWSISVHATAPLVAVGRLPYWISTFLKLTRLLYKLPSGGELENRKQAALFSLSSAFRLGGQTTAEWLGVGREAAPLTCLAWRVCSGRARLVVYAAMGVPFGIYRQ
jgi:hypothetical protein